MMKDHGLYVAGARHGERTVTSTPIRMPDSKGRMHWFVPCVCSCGRFDYVAATTIRKGMGKKCRPCGKYKIHGMAATPTYSSWTAMMSRCYRSKTNDYESYGGRGIRVFERWHGFEAFYADMGDRPEGKTLDRINSNTNYGPGLCRWATSREQARNHRNNVWVEAFGQKMIITDWSEQTGIHQRTIRARIANGWPVEKALTAPVRT